jgi:hypothetical protein
MATTYSLVDSAGGKFKLVQNPWRIQTTMPLAAGSYPIVVRATDTATGRTKDSNFTISIAAGGATAGVYELSVPAAQVNEGQAAGWNIKRTGPVIATTETLDLVFTGTATDPDFSQTVDDYFNSLVTSTPGLSYASAAPTGVVTYSPTDKDADITLSNGNLTANKAAGGNSNASARASAGQSSGIHYYEIKWDAIVTNTCYIGLVDSTYAVATDQPGQTTHGIGLSEAGTIYYNGATAASGLGALATGDRIGVYVNQTANILSFRKNGGNWNGNAANDPTVGGYTIPVALRGINLFPCFMGFWIGTQQSANFGNADFVDALPAGASAWGSSASTIRRLTFGPQFSGNLPISRMTISDNTTEGDQTAILTISNPTAGATISGSPTGTVTIKDTSTTVNNPPPPTGNSVVFKNVPWKVAGNDPEVPVGSQIALTSVKKIGVDTLPAGVTIRTGTSTIEGVTGTFKRIMVANANTVIDGWDFRDYGMDIQANGVTVRNCYFNHGGQPEWGSYGVRDFKPVVYATSLTLTGITIEFCTFDGGKVKPGGSVAIALWGDTSSAAVTTGQHTVRRNLIQFMPSDGIDVTGGLVEENYWHDNGYNYGAHVDGMEITGSVGGAGLMVRRNIFDSRGNNETAAILAVDGSNFDPGGQNAATRVYADGGATSVFRGKVEVMENIFRGGGHELMTFPYADGSGTLTLGEGYAYIHDNFFGGESPYGANCWITSADAGFPQSPPAKVYVQNNKLLDGTVLKNYNGLPPTDTGGGTGGGGTVINDYVPSTWAKTQSWGATIPFSLPMKDFPVGRISTAQLKSPTGQQGITSDAGTYYINSPGVYEDYDFRGKRAILTFTNTDPDAVIFRNCVFNNAYVTSVLYFGQDVTRGSLIRSDTSFEYCSFVGAQNGGGGECVGGWMGICHLYRCYFYGWIGDPVNVGGGSMYECFIEKCGNGDGVHYDVVNWADNSISPFYYYRNLIDFSLGKYPSAAGGSNSLLKLAPVSGPGPSHDLVFEENVAFFGGRLTPNDPNDQDNDSYYWFQNQGSGVGQYRFLHNYFDRLRQDLTLFIGIPGNNWGVQENYRLTDGTKWLGSNNDTTESLAKPGALTVSLAQNATTSTPTFSLPANTSFVEYQYRLKGDSRWLPKLGPIQITTGTAISKGSDYEMRFRPVFSTSGRRTTGGWTNPTYSSGGVSAPVISTAAAQTVAENSPFSVTLAADKTVTWALAGGNDQAKFSLSGAVLSMTAKDFEAPTDSDTNNVYDVLVSATAGGLTTTKLISVTVTDVSDTGGGSGEHAATADYATRVAAANSSVAYPSTWRAAIDTFIKALDVTTNNVWSYLLFGYISYNDSFAAAKQNLKSSAYPCVNEAADPPTFTRKAGFYGRTKNGFTGTDGSNTYAYTLAGAIAGNPAPDWGAAWAGGTGNMDVGIHYNSSGVPDGMQVMQLTFSQQTFTDFIPAKEELLGIDKAGGSVVQNYRHGTSKKTVTYAGAFNWDGTIEHWVNGYNPHGTGQGQNLCNFMFTKVLTDAEWAVLNTAWNNLLTTLKGLT